MEDLVEAARSLVGALDAPSLSADRSVSLVELLAQLEKIAAAGRTLVAARVAATRAWRSSGATSAAAWVARRAGTTLGRAAASLETAAMLEELPAVRDAFVSGRLSEFQAAEISAAAFADPSSEAALLAFASTESVGALRERCRDVRAAAMGDEDITERIRRGRYLRSWTDPEGAVRLHARLAPDDAAPLVLAIGARAEALRVEALRSGEAEASEAYAADALVSLMDGASEAVVHVHVSATALERGSTVAGETCRISGVGPISVAAARRLALRGSVKVIESQGRDVRRIAHTGRAIPAHIRTALETRDPTCVVPGCGRRLQLEFDHIVPLAEGGETTLENLARLCRAHHAQKTHRGWRLERGPEGWVWTSGSRDP